MLENPISMAEYLWILKGVALGDCNIFYKRYLGGGGGGILILKFEIFNLLICRMVPYHEK